MHMAQLMPLPLTVFCFSNIQIGFTFLVPAHLGSPRKRAVKQCVCPELSHVCVPMDKNSIFLEQVVVAFYAYNIYTDTHENSAVAVTIRNMKYSQQLLVHFF